MDSDGSGDADGDFSYVERGASFFWIDIPLFLVFVFLRHRVSSYWLQKKSMLKEDINYFRSSIQSSIDFECFRSTIYCLI